MLKAKIHRAKVTQCDIHYEGSIGIDSDWLKEAGILPNEYVEVYNITNGNRFSTYAIAKEAGSKAITINGAAARLAEVDDRVIICAYAYFSTEEAENLKPKVILLQ